jgi:hypothetical protein
LPGGLARVPLTFHGWLADTRAATRLPWVGEAAQRRAAASALRHHVERGTLGSARHFDNRDEALQAVPAEGMLLARS